MVLIESKERDIIRPVLKKTTTTGEVFLCLSNKTDLTIPLIINAAKSVQWQVLISEGRMLLTQFNGYVHINIQTNP